MLRRWSAAAKATRWAIPPERVCGNARTSPPSPRRASRALDAVRAWRRSVRQVAAPSATWPPTRMVGSRASTGSWGSRARVRPHSRRRVARCARSRYCPSRVMLPRTWSSGARVPITAWASRDLPDPLSPTIVTGRPRCSCRSVTSTSARPVVVTASSCRWMLIVLPGCRRRGRCRPGCGGRAGRAGRRSGRSPAPGTSTAPRTSTGRPR